MESLFALIGQRVEAAQSLQLEGHLAAELKAAELVRSSKVDMLISRVRLMSLNSADKLLIYRQAVDIMQKLGFVRPNAPAAVTQDSFLEEFILQFIGFFDSVSQEHKFKFKIGGLIRPTNGYVVQDIIKIFANFSKEYLQSKLSLLCKPIKQPLARLSKAKPISAGEVVVQKHRQVLPIREQSSAQPDKLRLANILFRQLCDRNLKTKAVIEKFRQGFVPKQQARIIRYNYGDLYSKGDRSSKSEDVFRNKTNLTTREQLAEQARAFDVERSASNYLTIRYQDNLPMLFPNRNHQRSIVRKSRKEELVSSKQALLCRVLNNMEKLPMITNRKSSDAKLMAR